MKLKEGKIHSEDFVCPNNCFVLPVGMVADYASCHLIYPQNPVQLPEPILYHDHTTTPLQFPISTQ